MNLFKKLLWLWRISEGIQEVKCLAQEHAGDPAYWIRNTHDALSIFLESSSQHTTIAKTTEEEGEIICEMFLERWDRSHGVSTVSDR